MAYLELIIVLAFGIGWMILEWQGRRLDRQRDEREKIASAANIAENDPQN